MKHARWAIGMIFLALLLALVPAGMAQNTGLSQEELATWSAANSASSAASSVQFDFKFGFAIEGVSNSLQIAGNGLYSRSPDNPLFMLAINGNRVVNNQTNPIDIEFRVTNGTLYYRSATSNNGQWRGQNFQEFATSVQNSNPNFPIDLNRLVQGDFSGFSPIINGFKARMPNLNINNYILTARRDNHFGGRLDLGSLLADPEVRNLLIAMAQQGQQSSGGSNGAMDQSQMANAAIQVALMLKSSRMTLDEWVTDGKVSRAVVTMRLNIDPSQIGAQGAARRVGGRFELNLSGYGAAYTVDAPADAAMAGGGQSNDLFGSDMISP